MFEYHKKESPIISLLGMGGGIGSYIFTAADTGYEIARSLRFDSGSSAYLDKSFSSGSGTTWTLAFWVKKTGNDNHVFGAGNVSTDRFGCGFNSSDKFFAFVIDSNSTVFSITTDAVYRDSSAWYHVVLASDTTNGTQDDRFKIYVNGVQQTVSGTLMPPSQDTKVNSATTHTIGRRSYTASDYFNGYLADVWFIDGSALEPTSFGTFDTYGVWQPKRYTGSKSGNSFHLPFSDNTSATTLGYDDSGNENNWTANNISGPFYSGTALFNASLSDTPFSDATGNETITNNGSITTSAAGTNNFNISNAGDFGGSNQWLAVTAVTIPTNYTIDYYYKSTNATQVSNATVIDSNGEVFIRDYGSATSRSLRLRDGSSYTTYSYSITINTWNHVRITNTGIWVNGTSINSSPRNIAGRSAGITIGSYNNAGGYQFDGLIGPIRILDMDLGAPTAGGEPTDSGSLPNTETGASTGADNDSLLDSPSNADTTTTEDTGVGGEIKGNYATWNPLNTSTYTFVNGNLEGTGYAPTNQMTSTIGVSSGKWYAEFVVSGSGGASNTMIGISQGEQGYYPGQLSTSYGYIAGTGQLYNNGSASNYGSTYTYGDVIGVALDMDAGTLTIYKNNTSQGQAASGLTGAYFFAARNSSTASDKLIANFGQRAFAYSAPSGFKALNTANLPTPTIEDPSQYVGIVTYTGTGSNITVPLNFEPDFTWTKCRTATSGHVLQNVVSGITTKYLQSQATDQEYDGSGGVQSTSSTGFVQGTGSGVNTPGETYVTWAWDAGSNSSKTYTVTVPGGIGGGFYIDGDQKPTINLEEGSTYTFDQSDSSNSGHPFRFSETSDGTHGAGTEYTTNVTTFGTPGSAGAYTRIEVAASAPTLYYYCSNHSAMGGQINTNSTAGASNFDGSIPSVVRANPTAGFSIVAYSGVGYSNVDDNFTVGHGLSQKPAMIIVKKRTASGFWAVWHTAFGDPAASGSNNKYIILSSSGAQGSLGAGYLFKDASTSDVFGIGVGAEVNGSGSDFVSFCFAPIEGYSAFGSYTGNGLADGPFIELGFRPAVIITKAYGTTSQWGIWDAERDPYNPVGRAVYPSLSNGEEPAGTYPVDFLSNGFKVRSTANFLNATSGVIYAAFAEHPFRSARAR